MNVRTLTTRIALVCAVLTLCVSAGFAAQSANPFIGAWELTIPGGGPGWLGVVEKDGQLSASILWGGGSVLPVTTAKVEGDKLVITRVNRIPGGQGKAVKAGKGDKAGKAGKTGKGGKGGKGGKKGKGAQADQSGPLTVTETITATLDGDNMKLTTEKAGPNGPMGKAAEFTGKRTPPMPPAPDLAKVKFGEPIKLFNGKDLTGWKLLSNAANGWTVKDGVLNNNPAQEEGKPHKTYANIRTEKEFEDFNLTLETAPPAGSNSGIYLRGEYEIQVMDSYGKPLDPHNMGAVYSRITPSEAAEKPAGEWSTFDITLVDRHITVILNGKKIIDNKPVEGCTGGALTSDISKPGPIYLQGDHSGANYRNIVLRPVVK